MGPSVVILDEGLAKTVTTSTLQSDVYGLSSSGSWRDWAIGLEVTKINVGFSYRGTSLTWPANVPRSFLIVLAPPILRTL